MLTAWNHHFLVFFFFALVYSQYGKFKSLLTQAFTFMSCSLFCFSVFTVWEVKAIAYTGIYLYFLVLSFALVYSQYGKLKPLLTQALTKSVPVSCTQNHELYSKRKENDSSNTR